ncbi:MAG: dihydroorotase [Deltaproteobacteria bacterium]|nr:dihydroorotase [Deltaproteobacteria bacterium]
MKLVIINGRVIDPSQNLDGNCTVFVENGVIRDVAKAKRSTNGYEIIDAKGAIVSPGFIDVHTHLREPGFEYREDIASGSKAAVAGGFTTIFCMANTNPVNDNASVTQMIVKKAEEVGLLNIFPVGAVSKGLKGVELAEIGEMVKSGCVAISDDGKPVMSGRLMRHALEYAKTFKIPVVVHEEDLSLAEGGCMNEGRISTELGLKGSPAAAEETMIQRDILLSKLVGHHVHFQHVTTATGIDMIRQAKKQGIPVTCEVTPHHLVLNDEACRGYNTNAKVNPPLRTTKDCQALIKALNDGTVDCLATDHAPHAHDEKNVGMDEANAGLLGMETALPVLLKLVHNKQVSLKRLIYLLTVGPAKIFKLKTGSLKKGWPADMTIFDPNLSNTIDAEKFYSKSRNTPFHGWKLKGKVLHTICGGKVVYA